MPPPPFVKSFLIADTVLQDRMTGKWSIIGIFDQVFSPTFPCVHPSLAIYVRLTDAQGNYKVKIELRDAEDQILSTFEGIQFVVEDRLKGKEFGWATHGLSLSRPGRYQFQLYLNDEYVASARLDAIKLERPPKKTP